MSNSRIFVGPTEIAGMYAQLVDGLNEIGLEAELVERNPHPFGYPSTRRVRSRLVDACRSLNKSSQMRAKTPKSPEVTFLFKVSALLIWLIWTPIAMTRYSSFIFAFGHSLWPWNLDLPILRILNKTTIMHLGHGSEARPPYLGGQLHLDAWTREGSRKLARESKKVMRTVQRSERYSSITIGSPFSTYYFATKPFINAFQIGIPQPVGCCAPLERPIQSDSPEFKVLHAPSKPEVKGTHLIIAAVEELKMEGLNISLVLLSGVTNDIVRRAICEVDLVVDQVYSDTPMPGLATEAASQGRATIVAGYGLTDLEPFLPGGLVGASSTCHPDFIKTAIRDALISGRYATQGELAKDFVAHTLSPKDVARRVKLILEKVAPSSWWVDPHAVFYLHGAGQSEAKSVSQIQGMVSTLGSSSLQLDHKPKLLDALTSWSL